MAYKTLNYYDMLYILTVYNSVKTTYHRIFLFIDFHDTLFIGTIADILDLLTVTNYIHQNLTANFSASHSCTLELPSGILSPYMLKMQLRLTLLNVYV